MKVASLFLGKPKQSTDVVKDEWAKQHRIHPEQPGYDIKGWRDRDRVYDQACRRAETWSWLAKFLGATTLACAAWGFYGTTRPDVITKYELIDRATGDKITTVQGTSDVPAIMMVSEMRNIIARCAFALSKDEVVEKECAAYRYRTFIDEAGQMLDVWRKEAAKRSELRTAQFMGARQSPTDKNMFDAEFEIKEYSGNNLSSIYRVSTNIRFDYAKPLFGLWLNDESGFKISYMPIFEKKGS